MGNNRNEIEKYKDTYTDISSKKMKKNEDKAEAKKMINMLWAKTVQDNNEYGVLVGGGNVLELDGDKNEISGSEWDKARWMLLDNPKIMFDFYHTHSEWDCPLSGDDISIFLRYKNIRSMNAITMESSYRISKRDDTVHIDFDKREEMIERYETYKEQIPISEQDDKNGFLFLNAYRQSLINVAKRLAKEYKFIYEEDTI